MVQRGKDIQQLTKIIGRFLRRELNSFREKPRECLNTLNREPFLQRRTTKVEYSICLKMSFKRRSMKYLFLCPVFRLQSFLKILMVKIFLHRSSLFHLRRRSFPLLRTKLTQATQQGKYCNFQLLISVKANLLLTHFGNLKWTHPYYPARMKALFKAREFATMLICSAMAAQSVPSEEPDIKVAPFLSALLTSGSSDGLCKRAHCLFEKNNVLFFRSRSVKSHGKTPAIQRRESLLWVCLLSLGLPPCDPSCGTTSR
jgi:hypothetical protein